MDAKKDAPHSLIRGTYPQKVLIVSDEHRGAAVSRFFQYKKNFISKLAEYDHIVELGDNVELFYTQDNVAEEYGKLIDVVAGKGKKHWRDKVAASEGFNYGLVKTAIKGETTFLKEFLEQFPHIQVHKVLGNHENVRRMRRKMDELQETHPNFEWSPEAVRIGDGIFTHAHLQMKVATDEQYPKARLREAHDRNRWRRFYEMIDAPGHRVVRIARRPSVAIDRVANPLELWSQFGGFNYSHERESQPFKSMDWVKHVFFGHTHVKFDHRDRQGVQRDAEHEGMLFHNTGAMVESTTARANDLGILEAELHADGKLHNIRPIEMEKDSISVGAAR